MRKKIQFSLGVLLSIVGLVSGAELLAPSQYPTIQAAIDAAVDWDTIIVAPGIYGIPDANGIDFRGKTITVRSTDANNQDVVSNTIVDCLGDGRGFYFHSSEDENSILEGLTVKNGCADKGGAVYCEFSSPTIVNCIFSGNRALEEGGGVYCYESSPNIANCRITQNGLGYCGGSYGGGIYASAGSIPTIANCTIKGNESGGSGGGIYCYSAIINNCTISNNTAGYYSTDHGGGIYCASATITNCIIAQNTTGQGPWSNGGNGGGIYAKAGSSPTITDCTIRDNEAGGGDWETKGGSGGGIYCFSGTISDCVIIRNVAGNGYDDWEQCGDGGDGGGVYCTSATITNSVITENRSGDGGQWFGDLPGEECQYGGDGGNGGGIYCNSATIKNCLIRDNRVGEGGSCMIECGEPGHGEGVLCKNWSEIKNCTIIQDSVDYNDLGSGTISNSIIWGAAIVGNPIVAYSDIEGGWPSGEGNINADPCFVTGPLGNYYLSQIAAGQPADSCCVDAGSESAVGLGMDELATRTDNVPDSGIVDMGYHYPPSDARSLQVLDPNGGETIVAGSTYTITWASNGPVREVLIKFSVTPVEPANVGNTGSYHWQVPIVNSDQCQIRISDTTFTNIYDTSDSPFTIFECKLKGDLNGDCKVDFEDMAVWAGEWLACGSNPFDPNWCGN